MNIKLFIGFVIVLALIFFWLLPKTRWIRKLKMSVKLFSTIHVIGVLTGVAGLLALIYYGNSVLSNHYYELILLPAFLAFLYSMTIFKVHDRNNIYDEKQNYDMTRAAAMTLPFSIAAMFLLFAMYKEHILEGLLWFPFFIFVILLVYSAATLLFFRNT